MMQKSFIFAFLFLVLIHIGSQVSVCAISAGSGNVHEMLGLKTGAGNVPDSIDSTITLLPGQEFRGVWLTSIVNLDWPVSNQQTVDEQKADLMAILDRLKKVGINAVLFQVRAEADALYASSYEPWSYWLTGEQGRAPDPFFDPLSFIVRESHRRGMELHAWLNPFRVERRKDSYPLAGSNVKLREPEWILEFELQTGDYYTMLDPGLPEVRDYIASVVMDIARRYDVDGIHFDDYFYPDVPMEDEDLHTYSIHHNGLEDIRDWRRDNVNKLVSQVYDSLQVVAPHISFGVSPFGVRKNIDAGTNSLEGYHHHFADGLAWLQNRSVDYINPQLYFEIGFEDADYSSLLDYWAQLAYKHGRHLYTGLSLYKLWPPADWTLQQAMDQLELNRNTGKVQGHIFFRTEHLLSNPKGYTEVLKSKEHRYPALTPTMPWKNIKKPPKVEHLSVSHKNENQVVLSWRSPDATEQREAVRYSIYRFEDSSTGYVGDTLNLYSTDGTPPGVNPVQAKTFSESRMLEVTGEQFFVDEWPEDRVETIYAVRAVSRNSVESDPVLLSVRRDETGFSFRIL